MKLYSLISAVALGVAAHVHAQEKPVLPSSQVAAVAKDPNMNPDGSVTLSSGTLGDVVAEIERRIGYWTPTDDGEKPVMPNIIFGTNTRDALVPGDLRLRSVSPVQALALTAAAAGCSLKPIFAPDEKAGQKAMIIGYRIVKDAALARSPSSAAQQMVELDQQLNALTETLGENHPSVISAREHLKQLMSPERAEGLVGIGVALAKKEGGIVVEQVIPGSPASLSPAIKPGRRLLRVADGGKPEVNVTGLELEKVVQMIRGAPGTEVKITLGAETNLGLGEHVFSLVRARLPVKPADAMVPKVMVVNPNPGGLPPFGPRSIRQSVFPSGTVPPEDNHRQFVRIYAFGAGLTGDGDLNGFRDLLDAALGIAGIERDQPKLDFHRHSRALIAKATAAQHEIIEQVIQVLKENETQPAAPNKP